MRIINACKCSEFSISGLQLHFTNFRINCSHCGDRATVIIIIITIIIIILIIIITIIIIVIEIVCDITMPALGSLNFVATHHAVRRVLQICQFLRQRTQGAATRGRPC